MSGFDWASPLTWIAPLVMAGAVATGVGSLLFPARAVRAFGLSAGPEGLRFVPVFGVRNLAIGLAGLGMLYADWRQPLAVLLLSLVVPAVVDTAITFRHGNGAARFAHPIGAVALLIYGLWLLR